MKTNQKNAKPFLFEIGTEELPTRAVTALSQALSELIIKELAANNLSFTSLRSFATPRRLGFLITDLAIKQADYIEEKRGPAIKAAFDENNNFTKAALGFAKSCGISPEKLEKLQSSSTKDPNDGWLIYKNKISGKKTEQLIPIILADVIKKLPISKPMRWGDYDYSFIRPVHWLVVLFGDKVVKCNLFGLKAANITYGHRFLAPKAIVLKNPAEYETKLNKAFVIANFDDRLDNINNQIIKATAYLSKKTKYSALINADLLTEVTSLVEWPVAHIGEFNPDFLKVPQECLITSMVSNQKYFAIVDNKNILQPYFIFISNIISKNKQQVILGNQKVLTARLSDAAFFYNNDKKQTLDARLDKLKHITYQRQLGSIFDKTMRVANLSSQIANQVAAFKNIKLNHDVLTRGCVLAKTDLCTEMVYEFPELQGIMGKYYALSDGENKLTADCIEQHYWPKFAGDALPDSTEASCLAIADKLDTVAGIFAIGQKPSGDKDPFALRRAALGILRLLIEKQLPLNLPSIIMLAIKNFTDLLQLSFDKQQEIILECTQFCFERLKKYYLDQGIAISIYYAVNNTTTSPYDFNQRMQAVYQFSTLPQAANLIAANKRVKNILQKVDLRKLPNDVDIKHLKEPAELNLFQSIAGTNKLLQPMFATQDYQNILLHLAKLQQPIDDFFDKVMVNSDDENLKNNRLLLLLALRNLFNQVADISELQ